MEARPETTATLGDRLDTDMEGGKRAGLRTIMVLSGSTDLAEAEAYRDAEGLDFIFEDIAELLLEWERASQI
jgi:ribonucleotide monophosphatase NagD (HAD superfamily)